MSEPLSEVIGIATAIHQRLDTMQQEQVRDRANASESRRRVHERLDNQTKGIHDLALKVASMDHRMEKMETAQAAAAPTLSEMKKVKQRVIDAGALGRVLWKAGAFLLLLASALYSIRAEIWSAISKLMSK